ncbi:MAG: DoxX family membrane protein [Dysgonamonadaceae bacterium]|jgi:thiosulfate dehydrogenase [quinone] large subunit|nr:DoxX family membrane protein [Dysgonamonadaceae bacterium]
MVYSKSQTFWLVALRILIGWHFLYEGLIKALNPSWTSFAYLLDSDGWIAPWLHNMARNAQWMTTVDLLNTWGLILIGLGLLAGCLTRIATISGIVLLSIYYLSHIPFIGSAYMMPAEGAYLWVDKNLIEIAALALLLLFPTSMKYGLDGYVFKEKRKK